MRITEEEQYFVLQWSDRCHQLPRVLAACVTITSPMQGLATAAPARKPMQCCYHGLLRSPYLCLHNYRIQGKPLSPMMEPTHGGSGSAGGWAQVSACFTAATEMLKCAQK